MAQLTGKDEDALASDLRGVIFRNPENKRWETADEYLSGNVREKLRIAQSAQNLFEGDYAGNVEALKAAQPKDLDASEIEVRLGATWIDPSYIREFMWETFETPFYQQRMIDVTYSAFTAEWNIRNKNAVSYSNIAAYMTYGTERANAYKILEDTLNLRDVRMSLTVEDFGRDFVLTLKGKMNHRVTLGKDARGNLTRIDNALNAMPDRLQNVRNTLDALTAQMETAKAELGKPFPQEDELRTKSARLAELNAELNIDDRTPMEQMAEDAPAVQSAKAERPSVLAKLKAPLSQPCAEDKIRHRGKEER